MNDDPYSFAQAREAARRASANQRAAEQFVIDTTRKYAAAEQAYRQALAVEILKLKASGMAVTACADVARGEPSVAALKFARDLAEGMREAASQSSWRASADRKSEQTLVEWSMKRDLADAYEPPTGDGRTFGRRAA